MDPRLTDDLARLPDLLGLTRDYASMLLTGLDQRPVAARPVRRPEEPLPERGIGLAAALDRFADRWESGLSGSAGPRYLGFVTGGATPASIAGDWLTSAMDQNAASGGDSAVADLEHETVRWLRTMFGLADEHTGSFVTGATTSNLVGLAIGREWLGQQYGVSVHRQGVRSMPPVRVLSGTPHASIGKAMSMLGLGRDHLRLVPVQPGREAVDLDALDAALAEGPAIVVANAGTVNTVDFDDLRAIARLKHRHRFWLHVDGAFGLFAGLSPQHAHLVDGLDAADSICVDLHKWLNVPYDSAVQFTRRRDLQAAVFHNQAAYLGGVPDENPDFLHLTPENSRRLRALPTWFALTAYGVAGHRDIVERNIASARRIGARIAALPGVRLLAPVRLNVVCFTVDGDVDAVQRAVADSGEAFLTPTVYDGVPALRMAVSNWRTGQPDESRIVAALAAALA